MEGKDYRLKSFFDSIYDAANPIGKSDEHLEKLDKCLAFECYLICGNRNSKLTAYNINIFKFYGNII